MKKATKKFLLAAAALAILGVVLILLALSTGFDLARLREEGIQTIVDELDVDFGVGGVNVYKGSADSEYRADGRYSVPADGIAAIRVDWVAGGIDVEPYDGRELVFSETAKGGISENTSLSWRLDGDTLNIYFARTGVSLTNSQSKDLTVKLPKSLADSLASVEIDTVSGRVELEDLTAERLTVNTTSADVKLDNVSAGETEVNTVSGRVDFSGTTESADIGTTSGAVELDMAAPCRRIEVDTISGEVSFSGRAEELQIGTTSGAVELDVDALGKRIEVNTVSGDVSLELPRNAGFTLDYDTASGDLRSKAPMTSDGVCGDGACQMKIDTTSGDLTIEYDD